MSYDFLTAGEACELLGISRRTLNEWERIGKLAPSRLTNKTLRWSRAAIEELLQETRPEVRAFVDRLRNPDTPRSSETGDSNLVERARRNLRRLERNLGEIRVALDEGPQTMDDFVRRLRGAGAGAIREVDAAAGTATDPGDGGGKIRIRSQYQKAILAVLDDEGKTAAEKSRIVGELIRSQEKALATAGDAAAEIERILGGSGEAKRLLGGGVSETVDFVRKLRGAV